MNEDEIRLVVGEFVRKQRDAYNKEVEFCLGDSGIPSEYHGVVRSICRVASSFTLNQNRETEAFLRDLLKQTTT